MISPKMCIWCGILLILPLVTPASDIDIFTAAEQGNLDIVEQLLQENPQLIDAADDRGYTALHKAAYNGYPDIVAMLLSRGADINAVSGSGSTPLHGAAFYGHPEVVRQLLAQGAEPDIVNAGGYSPLLSAGAGNHGDIVQLLVEEGANIRVSAADGRTPLYLAVWNADAGLTKFLLDMGAEANVQTDMGVSLPYFAAAFRDQEIGLMLADKAIDYTETDTLGLSMLHYAAARGFTEQVKMLLKRGVDANSRDSLGRTPLFYASLWRYDETVEILKSHGARVADSAQPWFRGDYLGRPEPGKTPVVFAGDTLRTPFAPHGAISISPDGKELFWCHQAMPIQAMWYTWQEDGLWQRPIIAPFTDPSLDYADGNPCFSADGSRIFYHTLRPRADGNGLQDRADIWYVDKTDEGWGEPVNLGMPVNTDSGEYSPKVAVSGNLYFFGSGYEDSYGVADIYLSEFIDGAYTAPRNLGPAINSEYHELHPTIPSDESYIIFASNRPYMFRNDLQLYLSFNNGGEWTKAIPLGRTINQGFTWHPFVTADDKYIIYQQGVNYYWFSATLIEDIREALVGPGQVDNGIRLPALRRSNQLFDHAVTNDIGLGDFDGDGDLDAVFSNMQFNDSRVYLNDGRGSFTPTEQLLTQQGHGVDVGDVDSDGDLDIFMTCAGYGVNNVWHHRPSKIYFNDGSANFTASTQDLGDSLLSGNNVRLYDIDTDGDLDAMIIYHQEENGIYLNDGTGQFTRSDLTFPTGADWADLDGDGDIDIFHREAGVGFKTLLNDGNGRFNEYWSKADSSIHRGKVGLGDFDGDGDTDVVVPFLDQSEHRHSTLWYNDGTGRFVESGIRLPLTRYATPAVGDLNGDGFADVFLNNFGLPSAVWLNDGQGGLFDSGIRLPGQWQNTACPLGDLDGDGDLDLFIAAFGGGPNEVWFND